MYIKRVVIENIRGFGSGPNSLDIDFTREDKSLAGWTVIAGRNGAGKTTFLRAIALALAGPAYSRALSESFASWIREGEIESSVTVTMAYSAEEDRMRGMGKLPKQNNVHGKLTWTRDDSGGEPAFHASPPQRAKLSGPWRGPWSENPEGWFVAGYGPFRRLTGHATEALRMMVGPYHVKRLVSLFREDASLVECVEWLKSVYLQRLEQRSGYSNLEKLVLRILDDGLLPDKMKVQRIDSRGLWVTQNGVELPLQEISDGYRTMAALVLDLIRQMFDCYKELDEDPVDGHIIIRKPGIVLVDEIDVHLHISWQQRIGFWLKEHFPNVQFIVSTHSPFICQAADSRGIIRLPAPIELGRAEHVKGDQFKQIVNGSADDAAMSVLFGLDSTRSEPARRKQSEYSKLRAKQIRGGLADKEKKRLGELQMELPLGPKQEVEILAETLRSLES